MGAPATINFGAGWIDFLDDRRISPPVLPSSASPLLEDEEGDVKRPLWVRGRYLRRGGGWPPEETEILRPSGPNDEVGFRCFLLNIVVSRKEGVVEEEECGELLIRRVCLEPTTNTAKQCRLWELEAGRRGFQFSVGAGGRWEMRIFG